MYGQHRLRAVGLATALLVPLAGASLAAPAQAATQPAAGQSAGATRDGAGHPGYERVGYFTQWGIYGANFRIQNLVADGTASKLTMLNYAFGNVSKDGTCFEANAPGQGDAWADYQTSFPAEQTVSGVADAPGQALAGNFNQIRELKAKFPQLRTTMSLGGWTWSKYFSDAALTDASRKKFVSSCIDLFIKGNLPQLAGDTHGGPGAAAGVFDGFDIDWEWPGSPANDGNVVRAQDKQNFTLLLAEFRRQLDELSRCRHHHYYLTAFTPADPKKIDAGLEVAKAGRYLDWANIQGYDLHGTWEPTTNHQSALYSPAGDPSPEKFSVDQAVQAHLDRGLPRSKVVVGVPFYSHGWTGVTNANHGLFQPATGPAPATFVAGTEDYKRLATQTGFTLYRDPKAGFAWLFDGTTFWTFDDPVVMSQKAAYIRHHDLRGVMAWSLDSDNGSLIAALDRGLR